MVEMPKITISKVKKRNILNANNIIRRMIRKAFQEGLTDVEFKMLQSSSNYLYEEIVNLQKQELIE